jgi:WD40 repeat protein
VVLRAMPLPDRPPGTATALSLPGARALLVGVGSHVPGSSLPATPAVAGTVRDLAAVLVERGGLEPARLTTLLDPADPIAFGDALAAAAAEAEDILVVYFAGHGLVGLRGELYLSTRASKDSASGLPFRALPYSAVRDAVAGSRARSVVIILDCCFSGRADAIGPAGAGDVLDASAVRGSYVLASAARDETALAPAGQPHTAFTGQLIRLLREGDPAGPRMLTLDHVYRALSRLPRPDGQPRPRRLAGDRGGDVILAPNAAYQPADGIRRSRPAVGEAGEAGEAAGAETVCPYRGLAPFDAEDARFFFGREELTAELVGRLADLAPGGGPVAVVGPSGAGKSSLLRAGLLPALRRGELGLSGSAGWPLLVITPGAHPMASLAARLGPLAGTPPGDIAAACTADPGQCAELVRQAAAAGAANTDQRLVLIVDQFEEVFTACQDEAERQSFIGLMCALAAPGGGHAAAIVVLGIRADFYGRCLTHAELVPVLRDRQLVVGPMTAGQLRAAIEDPAAEAGLALEPGLADLLIRDLRAGHLSGPAADGDPAGALPLLSHALLATWQQREGRLLTMAGYQLSGGIWQAVAQTAERIYTGLGPDAQQAARQVLLAMVRVVDDAGATRRRAPLADLMSGRPAGQVAAVTAVLDEFARPSARLITLDQDTAELAHEALIHAWPRLESWIVTDRAGLLLHQQLGDAAAGWQRDGEDSAALYRGSRLAAARDWAAEHGGELSQAEQSFLDAALAQEAAEQHAIRRRDRRRRILTATLAVCLALALTAGGIAVGQSRAAQQQQRLGFDTEILAMAESLRLSNPQEAARFGIASLRFAPTSQARELAVASLITSLASLAVKTVLTGQNGAVQAVAFSPDGRVLATASAAGTVVLWDVGNPASPRELATLANPGTGFTAVAFSPAGGLLATSSQDGTALWDVRDPARPQHLATLAAGASGALAFGHGGEMLAAAGPDGNVTLWRLTDSGRPQLLTTISTMPYPGAAGPYAVSSIAFSPDGQLLATADYGWPAILWQVTNPARPQRLSIFSGGGTVDISRTPAWELPTQSAEQGSVSLLAFSPNGRLLATDDSFAGEVDIWNVTRPAQPAYSSYFEGHNGLITALAFSPDGKDLASGATDKTTMISSVADLIASRDAATNPGAQGGITAVPLGTGIGPPYGLIATLAGETGQVDAIAYSPSGTTLATSGANGLTILWQVTDLTAIAEHPLAEACATAGELTSGQWSTVFPNVPYPQRLCP